MKMKDKKKNNLQLRENYNNIKLGTTVSRTVQTNGPRSCSNSIIFNICSFILNLQVVDSNLFEYEIIFIKTR